MSFNLPGMLTSTYLDACCACRKQRIEIANSGSVRKTLRRHFRSRFTKVSTVQIKEAFVRFAAVEIVRDLRS